MSNESEYREIMAERMKARSEYLSKPEADWLEREAYDKGFDEGRESLAEDFRSRCDCTCKKCGCCR
jgi:hypothetical protein